MKEDKMLTAFLPYLHGIMSKIPDGTGKTVQATDVPPVAPAVQEEPKYVGLNLPPKTPATNG